jgi:heme-degrading monooxygenase HmoA
MQFLRTVVVTRYTYIWEFHVEPARRAEFEQCYGPSGPWSALFRRADGYIETVLLRDRSDTSRYVTIDTWQSVEAYRAFRARFSQEYDDLDRECERLTSQEASLGEFLGDA